MCDALKCCPSRELTRFGKTFNFVETISCVDLSDSTNQTLRFAPCLHFLFLFLDALTLNQKSEESHISLKHTSIPVFYSGPEWKHERKSSEVNVDAHT